MMNKLICVLTVILYVGSAANSGFAQSSEIPSNETLELWGEFKAKYGENWKVSWNEHTGTPKTIFGYHYDIGMGEVADETKAKASLMTLFLTIKSYLK